MRSCRRSPMAVQPFICSRAEALTNGDYNVMTIDVILCEWFREHYARVTFKMMGMGGCASKLIATTARNLVILHAPIFPMSSFLPLNSEVEEWKRVLLAFWARGESQLRTSQPNHFPIPTLLSSFLGKIPVYCKMVYDTIVLWYTRKGSSREYQSLH